MKITLDKLIKLLIYESPQKTIFLKKNTNIKSFSMCLSYMVNTGELHFIPVKNNKSEIMTTHKLLCILLNISKNLKKTPIPTNIEKTYSGKKYEILCFILCKDF